MAHRTNILNLLVQKYGDRPFDRHEALTYLHESINRMPRQRRYGLQRHTVAVYLQSLIGNTCKIMFNIRTNRASSMNHRGLATDVYLIKKREDGKLELYLHNIDVFLNY